MLGELIYKINQNIIHCCRTICSRYYFHNILTELIRKASYIIKKWSYQINDNLVMWVVIDFIEIPDRWRAILRNPSNFTRKLTASLNRFQNKSLPFKMDQITHHVHKRNPLDPLQWRKKFSFLFFTFLNNFEKLKCFNTILTPPPNFLLSITYHSCTL